MKRTFTLRPGLVLTVGAVTIRVRKGTEKKGKSRGRGMVVEISQPEPQTPGNRTALAPDTAEA